jgi:hypothetical protein
MKNFIGNLFRARKTDPITSHQAAESIKKIAPHHMQAIHDCLHQYGPRGKDGIARITKLGANQVARRLPEMAKMGLVEQTGEIVLSDAGRKERQWRGL